LTDIRYLLDENMPLFAAVVKKAPWLTTRGLFPSKVR